MKSSAKQISTKNDGKIEEYEDGRSYNSSAVREITQNWVDTHMKEREGHFTDAAKVSMFCGTWNVNAKKQDGDLHEWLLPNGPTVNVDIYAIGFQEMVDLNAMNVIADNSKSQQRSVFWSDKIAECLEKTGVKYQPVAVKYLVGLLICVFAKETLVPHIKDVRTTSLGVGIMGILGNKGGVSVRMWIHDSSVCFVCSHLAAHRENVAGRNSDFKNILERSLFVSESVNSNGYELPNESTADATTNAISSVQDAVIRPRHGADKTLGIDLNILDHELIFWLGDLNYRFDEEISTDQVFECCDANNWSLLRDHDQLNRERKKGAVFQGFHEGEINFPPTYKYEPGTDAYDRRPEKKIRAPAWCDRILWKVHGNMSLDSVKQLTYKHARLLPSDHKPVSSMFSCQLRVVIANKFNACYKELMGKLERYQGKKDQLPMVDITGLKIDLPLVYYDVPIESIIQVSNNGVNSTTIAHWHFVSKLEDTSVCRRWIQVSQQNGLLLPGESVNITLTVRVDKKTAQALHLGRELLEDVLILRIENSGDYFVSVVGGFQRSCYGMCLEELVLTTQPIRETKLPAIWHNGGNADLLEQPIVPYPQGAPQQTVPKEIWRLLDALSTGGHNGIGNALKQKDLFVSTEVDENEVIQIRESLDCNVPFPTCSPHALVEALLSLLSSMPRPVLPIESYPTGGDIDATNLRTWSKRLLDNLPPLNYNLFVYLLSFMQLVLSHREYNRTTSTGLATVLVECLMPNPQEGNLSQDEQTVRENRQQRMLPILEFLLNSQSMTNASSVKGKTTSGLL